MRKKIKLKTKTKNKKPEKVIELKELVKEEDQLFYPVVKWDSAGPGNVPNTTKYICKQPGCGINCVLQKSGAPQKKCLRPGGPKGAVFYKALIL